MRKTLRYISAFIYFFTAQLSVHAFTMHPPSHGEGRGSIEHQHEDKKSDYGHPQPSHDHSFHYEDSDNEDHRNHDMTMCLEQSVGVLVIHDIDILNISLDIIPPVCNCYETKSLILDQYFYSLHDPGRGQNGTFSKFLKYDLYRHGVIMHC